MDGRILYTSRARGGRAGAPVLLLAILSVFLAFPTGAAARCPPRDNDVVTPWRQVSWEDFRGRAGGRLSPEAAHIATALKVDDIEAEVVEEAEGKWVARPKAVCLYAAMDKLHSARKPGVDTEAALRHEQLHFDLTELAARRLYPQLMVLEGRGESYHKAQADLYQRIRQAHNAATDAAEKLQREYDEATAHGTSWLMQKAWRRKIGKWLDETPAFDP